MQKQYLIIKNKAIIMGALFLLTQLELIFYFFHINSHVAFGVNTLAVFNHKYLRRFMFNCKTPGNGI